MIVDCASGYALRANPTYGTRLTDYLTTPAPSPQPPAPSP